MAANNSVHLIGNLTRDPEVRVTPKGTSIASFSLAVNRRWKDESGQVKEEVTFVECEFWGKSGEVFAKHHKKGNQAAVEGRLKMDQWEDKTTKEKKSKLKVVVDDFTWQNQRTAGGSPEAAEDAPAPRQAPRSAAPAPTAGLEDDVPF